MVQFATRADKMISVNARMVCAIYPVTSSACKITLSGADFVEVKGDIEAVTMAINQGLQLK